MDAIDRLRRFNRDYTARMGLLSRDFLDSGLSLTEARVMYELSLGEGVTARDLSGRLQVDEGYLSRVIKRFAARGWLERRMAPGDARQRMLRLTSVGQAAFAPLRRKSREDVAARVPRGAAEHAADCADRLMAALDPDPEKVELRDPAPGDAGWIVQRHAELYARDEGFDITFEALVAEVLADILRNRDPSCEGAWIAARGAVRLGSIFCMRQDADTAKLRLFLLEPEARGLGLGRRMLRTCMGFARGAGYRRMQLWTHESHRAACALYASEGWRLVASEPKRSFGVDVVEQQWDVAL